MCKKLLEIGMTPKELFGEKIDELIKSYYLSSKNPQLPKNFDNKEFREGLALANKPMTKDEIIAVVMEMKAKGKI